MLRVCSGRRISLHPAHLAVKITAQPLLKSPSLVNKRIGTDDTDHVETFGIRPLFNPQGWIRWSRFN
jgi:hypothetical protein